MLVQTPATPSSPSQKRKDGALRSSSQRREGGLHGGAQERVPAGADNNGSGSATAAQEGEEEHAQGAAAQNWRKERGWSLPARPRLPPSHLTPHMERYGRRYGTSTASRSATHGRMRPKTSSTNKGRVLAPQEPVGSSDQRLPLLYYGFVRYSSPSFNSIRKIK